MAFDDVSMYKIFELEKKAKQIIEKGCQEYTYIFRKLERELRIIKYCNDRPYVHWEIFKLNSEYYICKLKWYFETDWEKCHSPVEMLKYIKGLEPTIMYSCKKIHNEIVDNTIVKLSTKINDVRIISNKKMETGFRYKFFLNESNVNILDVQLNKDDNQKLSFVTEFIEIIEKLTNE